MDEDLKGYIEWITQAEMDEDMAGNGARCLSICLFYLSVKSVILIVLQFTVQHFFLEGTQDQRQTAYTRWRGSTGWSISSM